MRASSYVVLDTETTGLRPGRHGLTELYAARTDGFGNVREEFHSLINPGHRIPSFITRLTGITDALVKDAPSPAEAVEGFSRFLRDDDVLVGHNLRFDRGFLDHARRSALQRPFLHDGVCTLLLSRRVFAHDPLPSYKLGVLAQSLGISSEGAHRAQADVLMTVQVQQRLFERLETAGVKARDEVLRLQRLPLAKAARFFA